MMTVDPPNDAQLCLFMLSHTYSNCSSPYQEVESTAQLLDSELAFWLAKNEAKVVISHVQPKSRGLAHFFLSWNPALTWAQTRLTAVGWPHMGLEQRSPLWDRAQRDQPSQPVNWLRHLSISLGSEESSWPVHSWLGLRLIVLTHWVVFICLFF